MDPPLLPPEPMQLFAALLDLQLADRLSYDTECKTLFANFEGISIRSADDIESVRRCSRRCAAASATRSRWSSTTTASTSVCPTAAASG